MAIRKSPHPERALERAVEGRRVRVPRTFQFFHTLIRGNDDGGISHIEPYAIAPQTTAGMAGQPSVRNQDRHRHSLEDLAARPAEHEFPETRMAIGAHGDEIGPYAARM
jgi:hypothetical protein